MNTRINTDYFTLLIAGIDIVLLVHDEMMIDATIAILIDIEIEETIVIVTE